MHEIFLNNFNKFFWERKVGFEIYSVKKIKSKSPLQTNRKISSCIKKLSDSSQNEQINNYFVTFDIHDSQPSTINGYNFVM